jgi:hypothetical protein
MPMPTRVITEIFAIFWPAIRPSFKRLGCKPPAADLSSFTIYGVFCKLFYLRLG